MDEMRLSVVNGYRILQIHEVYEYEVTQYVPETREGRIFVAYMNKFLKLKAETSGYPGWVHHPEEGDRYVDSFWHSEGTRLDKEAIRYNAAKRGLATLCLNSMWGN